MIEKLIYNPYTPPLLLALAVSLVLTWVMRHVALRSGLLDKPGGHKQHAEPIPTLGGVAVFAGFTLSVAAYCSMPPSLVAILIGGVFMVTVGLADDLWGVRATAKLAALAVASAILVYYGDVVLRLGYNALWGLPVTFLWIGFVSSAFNGMDNADGAAGGVTVLLAVFAFVIAWQTWQKELALVAAALCGSAAGFLFMNFPAPRAKIFLGDSGSFFLGFVLSAMLVLGEWGTTPFSSAAVALTLLAVSLFDFTLILVLRGVHGHYRDWIRDPICMCARDHTYHRLVAFGLSPREAIMVLYMFAVMTGVAAVAMSTATGAAAIWWLTGVVCVCLVAVAILDRAPLPEDVYAHIEPTVDKHEDLAPSVPMLPKKVPATRA